jgi:hypothetical protein
MQEGLGQTTFRFYEMDEFDIDTALSLTEGQIDAVNVLLGTKANQNDVETLEIRINAQNIYKPHLDFASPLAYSKNLKKSKTTVNTVDTIKGMDSPVSTHSIDQFTPSMVHADGTVSVKRQTAKQSIKNGIKHTVTYHPVGKAMVSV